MSNTAPADVNDIIMGGGAPTAKFPEVGTLHKGRIIASAVQQATEYGTNEPKTWSNGDPVWEAVITIATDERDAEIDNDDGTRRIYASGAMLAAIRTAVQVAGAKGIEVGGVLAVKYDHDGTPSKPGFNPPKQFVAQYLAPDPVNDLLGATAPAAAPAQPAPQQAAPVAPLAPASTPSPVAAPSSSVAAPAAVSGPLF